MVVAIYYFLHQAGIRMKVFAFAIYTCGMFAYLGMMLLESGMAMGVNRALRAGDASLSGGALELRGNDGGDAAKPGFLGALAGRGLSAFLLEETGRARVG